MQARVRYDRVIILPFSRAPKNTILVTVRPVVQVDSTRNVLFDGVSDPTKRPFRLAPHSHFPSGAIERFHLSVKERLVHLRDPVV